MARRINTPFLLILLGTIAAAVLVIGGLVYVKMKNDPLRHIRHGDEFMAQEMYKDAHGSYMRAIGKDGFTPAYFDKAIDSLLLIQPETQEDANARYAKLIGLLFKKAEIATSDESMDALRRGIKANRVILEGLEFAQSPEVAARFETMGQEFETFADIPETAADQAWFQCQVLEHDWRFAASLGDAEWEEALKRLDELVELDPTNQFNQYVRLRAKLDRAMSALDGVRRRVGERELQKVTTELAEARAVAGDAPEFDLLELDIAHRQFMSERSTDIPNLKLAESVAEKARSITERQRIIELSARLQFLAQTQVRINDRDYVFDAIIAMKDSQADLAAYLHEIDPDDWRNSLLFISTRSIDDIAEATALAEQLVNQPMPTVGANARRHDITRLQSASYLFRAIYSKLTIARSELRALQLNGEGSPIELEELEGEFAIELETFVEAYDKLREIIETSTAVNPEFLLQLELDFAYAHSDWDKALESVNQMIGLGVEFDSAKSLVAADVAMRAGDFGAAVELVNAALNVRPELHGDIGFSLVRARLAFESGNFESAAGISAGVVKALEATPTEKTAELAEARALLRNAEQRGRPESLGDDPLTKVYADAARAKANGDTEQQRAILQGALAKIDSSDPQNAQEKSNVERGVRRLLSSLAIIELVDLDGDAEMAQNYADRLLAIDPEDKIGILVTEVGGKDRLNGIRIISALAAPDNKDQQDVFYLIGLTNEAKALSRAIEASKELPDLHTVEELATLENDYQQILAETELVQEAMLAQEEKSSEVLRYLLTTSSSEGNFDEAEEFLAEIILQDGESWRTVSALANILVAKGDLQEAVEALEKAIDEGRSNARVWRTYGRVLLDLGRNEESKNALATGHAKAPGDARIALDYATALYRSGDAVEALQILRAASAVGRSNPAFFRRWMSLEAQIGNTRVALAERKHRWDLYPADWENAVAYAGLLVSSGADWRDVLDPKTNRPQITAARWSKMSRVEQMQFVDSVRNARSKETEGIFEELLARSSVSPFVLLGYANVLSMKGERDQGIDLIKARLADKTKSMTSRDRAILCVDLASRYLEVAENDVAEEWIDRARAAQPDGDPVADRLLVELWQSQNAPKQLAETLRRLLELDDSEGAETRAVHLQRLRVRALLDAGQAIEAAEVFERNLGDSTSTQDLLIAGALQLEKARTAQLSGDSALANAAFESSDAKFKAAGENSPGAIEPWLQRARLFALGHEWSGEPSSIQEAIKFAREGQRRDASSWVIHNLLVMLLIRAEDIDGAVGTLEGYLEENLGNDEARQLLMEMYLSMGRIDRAVELCQSAVDRNPFSIPWNVRLGKLRGDQGRYAEASVSFKRLFDSTRDPGVARLYVEMRLLRDPPDHNSVLGFARENVALFREDAFLTGAYAGVIAHGGQTQNAFQEFEKAYKRFMAAGASPTAMQQLVSWLPRIVEIATPDQNIAEQTELLLESITNGNLDLGSRFILIQAWLKQGVEGRSRALEHLRVLTTPGDMAHVFGSEPYEILGSLYYATGNNCQLALEAFEKGLELAPTSPTLLNNVAFARAQCDGDLEQALREAMEASRLDPLSASTLDTLGYIHIKGGNFDAAEKALRQSLARNRTIASVLHLAEVKIAQKKWDEAETLLKEAGDSSPNESQQKELTVLVAKLAATRGGSQ